MPRQTSQNGSTLNKVLITIPEMQSFEDVRTVLGRVIDELQTRLLNQFPITNYQGHRISNVAVPVGADDVVTLRYLQGDKLPPQTTLSSGGAGPGYDKATFGILTSLTVSNGLTNYYICKNSGSFIETSVKIKDQAPSGSDAHLDIKLSTDDGSTWNSIFTSPAYIVLPNGGTATVTVSNYTIPQIAKGNLLRIDCLQAGSTNPGKGIEVVTKWSIGPGSV